MWNSIVTHEKPTWIRFLWLHKMPFDVTWYLKPQSCVEKKKEHTYTFISTSILSNISFMQMVWEIFWENILYIWIYCILFQPANYFYLLFMMLRHISAKENWFLLKKESKNSFTGFFEVVWCHSSHWLKEIPQEEIRYGRDGE